jgi:hypothetical protein
MLANRKEQRIGGCGLLIGGGFVKGEKVLCLSLMVETERGRQGVLAVRDASLETKERSYCSCDAWREQKREAGMCSGCSERGGKEAGGDSRKNSDREMGGGGLGDGEKSEERREVERCI